MGTQITNKEDRFTPEYLAQLLKDKKQIQAFPNVFLHAERLLDEEISKVRVSLFHVNGTQRDLMVLPEPQGPVVTLSEKLYVPVKEHPDFNFVGRILGPRGMTAKHLEQDTGCKIMVRGKGSMRDKAKEEQNRGKPNWEHLNEDLHVLITVEDTKCRADMKLARAVNEVKKLLVPAPEGEDDLKKMQLMELAIINGTYRDNKVQQALAAQCGGNWLLQQTLGDQSLMYVPTSPQSLTAQEAPRLVAPHMSMPPALRSPTPAGAPLILAPRVPNMPVSAGLLNGIPPPLMSPTEAGLLYSPYDYPYAMAHSAGLLEYPSPIESSAAGAVAKVRRTMGVREHPYPRVSLT